MHKRKFSIRIWVACGAMLGLSSASAAIVQLQYADIFSDGAVAPTGAAPWLEVIIDDDTGNGSSVELTINALSSLNDADVIDLYFNVNPAISLDPNGLTGTQTDNLTFALDSITGGDGSVGPITTAYGTNGYQADGDGLYDIRFDLPPPPGTDVFSAGETIVYTVTRGGGAALTAMDFFELSAPAGGSGPFISAAHLRSTGPTGDDSAWISATVVPLPAAAWLLVSSLGMFGIAMRRRRKDMLTS